MKLAIVLAALGVSLALLICGALWDSLGVIAVPMIVGMIGMDTYLAFFGDRPTKRSGRVR